MWAKKKQKQTNNNISLLVPGVLEPRNKNDCSLSGFLGIPKVPNSQRIRCTESLPRVSFVTRVKKEKTAKHGYHSLVSPTKKLNQLKPQPQLKPPLTQPSKKKDYFPIKNFHLRQFQKHLSIRQIILSNNPLRKARVGISAGLLIGAFGAFTKN